MKKLVIDTNKLISALISPHGRTAEKIVELSKEFQLCCCHFLYVEIFSHKEKILKASKLEEAEFLELMLGLLNKLRFISGMHIEESNWKLASDFCIEKDPKDIPHIALALHLDCPIWSGDEKLKKHLQFKGFKKIFDF